MFSNESSYFICVCFTALTAMFTCVVFCTSDVEDGYTKSTNVLREGQPLYKRVDKLRPEARRNLVSTRFKVLSFIRLNVSHCTILSQPRL